MVAALYTAAALLTLAFLVVAARALVADRSKGRKRCPRCFFAMEGIAEPRCPECGRAITDPRQLHRTRRRWGVALLAALLLLPPAALTGGLARVRQAGAWRDVPGPVLVRLLWLGDEGVNGETVARVRAGSLTRAQAERVVRYASGALDNDRRRDEAYRLLESLARNSYVLRQDRPGAMRPMLEELAPDRSVPALLARLDRGEVSERARVIRLLSHLRDADERTNLEMLAHLASEDPDLVTAAQEALGSTWRRSETVGRLPEPPRFLAGLTSLGRDRDRDVLEAASWLGDRIGECGHDIDGVRDLARGLIDGTTRPPDASDRASVLMQECGLWLLCRLDRASPECWAHALRLFESGDHRMRHTAIRQTTTFDWSDDVAALLRRGLRDDDWLVQSAAVECAAWFGEQAAELVPDLLGYVARPRRGGSSAFPEDFAAIGGDPHDLLDAIVDRLRRRRAEIQNGTPSDSEPIFISMEFMWIANLGVRSDEAAEVVRWFVENVPPDNPTSGAAQSILAYAALTGDREYVTRAVLGLDPDLTQPLFVGSPQHVVLDLLRLRLGIDDMLVEHFVKSEATRQPVEFMALLDFLSGDRLADFAEVVRTLATSEDPAVAQTAQSLLQKLP